LIIVRLTSERVILSKTRPLQYYLAQRYTKLTPWKGIIIEFCDFNPFPGGLVPPNMLPMENAGKWQGGMRVQKRTLRHYSLFSGLTISVFKW
jgi:hypothetical protein